MVDRGMGGSALDSAPGSSLSSAQRDDAVVLGIDCSTTACKVIAWDAAGRAVSTGRAPIALMNPGPDAWEQDAEAWWEATTAATREAVAGLGADGSLRVRALGITHQRETFVVTDEHGVPLHAALVWMDARCRPEVAEAVRVLGEARLHAVSGKPPCTTPSLYKLLFLLGRGAPSLRARSPRVLDVHALLSWRLTGRVATSRASADPLGLMDMEAGAFSPELLALAGLVRDQLPALCAPGDVIAGLSADAAARLGLPEGVPVVAGAGDGQAAALGAGLRGPGAAYLNLGTAIVSGVVSPAYRIDRAFRTMYAATPGAYLLETDLKGGTFTLSWLVERLLGRAAGDAEAVLGGLEREARGLPPGADGLLLVPYWNGVMNPYWDDGATGITLGWHGGHAPAHLYRAILEGIALEQRLHTEAVEAASGAIDELLVMGGGSRSDLWCQILADVTGKPVVRAGASEASALGAGILAAWAAGLFPDLGAAVDAMTSRGATFTPGPQQAIYDRLYREVFAGVYPALAGALGRLAALRVEARATRMAADPAASAASPRTPS
ncbi:FGGY-family carbohydrate kinase [Chondromyces apiculatus]|uniref:Carbohydrate kinase, FGGY n=1 Tax=Chondromyces apiculatus DSM 436 TaxID=1192034 RepID=A0A017T0H3_9BACT|nr:FGGY family carbohydrate kinase [Chondromyces apiculatus]EYF02492.1 carbohydrate kinase, FGGY [Chondromyces apiculatus DSM 436]